MKNPLPLQPTSFFFSVKIPNQGGRSMSTHRKAVALGLHQLADDVLTGDRLVDGLQWYYREREADGTSHHPVPVLPRAMHDALCPALAVLIHDEAFELVVCDRCQLAVENGAL